MRATTDGWTATSPVPRSTLPLMTLPNSWAWCGGSWRPARTKRWRALPRLKAVAALRDAIQRCPGSSPRSSSLTAVAQRVLESRGSTGRPHLVPFMEQSWSGCCCGFRLRGWSGRKSASGAIRCCVGTGGGGRIDFCGRAAPASTGFGSRSKWAKLMPMPVLGRFWPSLKHILRLRSSLRIRPARWFGRGYRCGAMCRGRFGAGPFASSA